MVSIRLRTFGDLESLDDLLVVVGAETHEELSCYVCRTDIVASPLLETVSNVAEQERTNRTVRVEGLRVIVLEVLDDLQEVLATDFPRNQQHHEIRFVEQTDFCERMTRLLAEMFCQFALHVVDRALSPHRSVCVKLARKLVDVTLCVVVEPLSLSVLVSVGEPVSKRSRVILRS